MDLALFIGHEVLAEGIAGDIRALHAEGEALQHAVIRSLFNANASGLCLVDKALSGLGFHDDRLAVFLNGEAVGLLIKNEALGCFGFLQRVIAVGQMIQLIDAVGQLLHLAHKLSATVYLKDCAAQVMIGIVFIHLGQLNAAANELVGDLDLDHSAVLIYLHGIRRLIQHIALRRGDFTDHILAIGDTCKGEAAVLCGNSGQNRLCAVCKEQADGSSGQRLAVLILLHAVDLSVDHLVGNALSVIDGKLHNGDFLTGIGEGHRVLLIGEDVVAVGADFLDIVAAEGYIALEHGFPVFVKGHDLDQSVRRNDRAVRCGKFLGGIEAESHGGEFVIHADAELLVLLQHLGKRNPRLLSVIAEVGSGFGDLNLLPGIDKLCGMGVLVNDHAVGCFHLGDFVFSQIQRLALR